jgi:hypothetical protein
MLSDNSACQVSNSIVAVVVSLMAWLHPFGSVAQSPFSPEQPLFLGLAVYDQSVIADSITVAC